MENKFVDACVACVSCESCFYADSCPAYQQDDLNLPKAQMLESELKYHKKD